MKEAQIVKKIRDWLKAEGALVFKYHGSVYGIKGFSDLHGVLPCGRAFFLEVKVPGKKPEPFQQAFLDEARRFGAVTGWADSLDKAKELLSIHMTHHR